MAPPGQLPHRPPAPQRKRQAQFVRSVTANQAPDPCLRLGLETTPRARLGPARPALQPRQAPLGKAPADVENPRPGQARLRRDRFIGQAALAQSHHLPPTLLLGCRRQTAQVHMIHPAELDRTAGNSTSPRPDQ